MSHPSLMPALFVGHGSPMNAIENNPFTAAWRQAAAQLPRPRAILCISAHWQTGGTAVATTATPTTIHDFYGFPDELYRVSYPAPGAPELAARVTELLGTAVRSDDDWGLDHGSWSVLRHMFPEAQIPVVQLSLDHRLPPRKHYALARRLQPLREEEVLVLGSGNLVHNLPLIRWNDPAPYPWAESFDRQAAARIAAGDHDLLIDYPLLGKEATLAVPTNEHYLPLLYALALQRPGEACSFFAEGLVYASLSMRSVRIG